MSEIKSSGEVCEDSSGSQNIDLDKKITGKTLDEIIDLDPDVDDLSWREVCYIVALGMGDIVYRYDESFEFQDMTSITAGNKSASWPAYHETWEHAGRILEAMPDVMLQTDLNENVFTFEVAFDVKRDFGDWSRTYAKSIIKSITKAAAKCILQDIELEVSG